MSSKFDISCLMAENNNNVVFRDVMPCSVVSVTTYQATRCHIAGDPAPPFCHSDSRTVCLYNDPPGDEDRRSRAGDLSVRRAGTD